MLRILQQIAKLLRLCVTTRDGAIGILLYCVVLALELLSIAVALRLIAWTKSFYDALQQMNSSEALRQIGIFGLIVLLEVARNLLAIYLRKILEIRWRRVLTAQVLDRWLAGKAYLRADETADGGTLDNPDQRIAEDCRIFLAGPATDHGSSSGFIPLSMDVVTKIVGLVSYLTVLWGLSTFPLDLSPLGVNIALPHYMVWMAFIYVILSTGLTHVLGRPLKDLYFNQQRREADYRFALIRIRENADAIAMSDGEAAERSVLDHRFDGIVSNWKKLIGRELILSSFTYPYRFTVLRIPTFLALPAYFGGAVTFGGLMQLGSAFANVVTTLSWFIFAYRPLAELAASTSRLSRFLEVVEQKPAERGIARLQAANTGLHVQNVQVKTPQGRVIMSPPSFSVAQGEGLWISGPSGIGKTTLMKALAGIWPYGEGRICFPDVTSLFLPQHPYTPLGTLADAIAYPRSVASFESSDIDGALNQAELGHHNRDDGTRTFSGGERQRLAIARVFLHRPDWVFLDEATSALDRDTELLILKRLRLALPNAAFVIVSHREPTSIGSFQTIELSSANA